MSTINKQNVVVTPIWQTKAFHEWVKTVLISEIVDENSRVCQIFAEEGKDLGKWHRSSINELVIIDDSKQLEIAKNNWIARGKPFPCSFLENDNIFDVSEHERDDENVDYCSTWVRAAKQSFGVESRCDFVFSSKALNHVFHNEATLDQFLTNIKELLRPGGTFFGVVVDSAQAWTRAQKQLAKNIETGMDAVSIRNPLYELIIDGGLDNFSQFGTSYRLTVADTSASEGDSGESRLPPPTFVHFPTLIDAARKHNLLFVEACNFMDFYDDHKRNHHATLRKCGVVHGKSNTIEQGELIALSTTFIFKLMEAGLD